MVGRREEDRRRDRVGRADLERLNGIVFALEERKRDLLLLKSICVIGTRDPVSVHFATAAFPTWRTKAISPHRFVSHISMSSSSTPFQYPRGDLPGLYAHRAEMTAEEIAVLAEDALPGQ